MAPAIQPVVVAAVLALTFMGYVTTVGFVHSSRPAASKQTHRDTAYTLDLESRLALALDAVERLKGDVKSLKNKPAKCPPAPPPPPCECPSCTVSGDTKKTVSTGSRHLYQHFIKAAEGGDKWGGIPIIGNEHPYGFSGREVSGVTVLGRDPNVGNGDLRSCKYLDLLFQHQKKGRCTMVVDQETGWHHAETPCTRPHCGSQDGEGFTPPFGVSYILDHEGSKPKPAKIEIPRENVLKWLPEVRDKNLLPFLNSKKDTEREALKIIGRGDTDKKNPESLLVMTANRGHMGLLLNFFCSLKAAGIKIPKHFVVAPTASLRDSLVSAGITAFYHEGLGKFTDKPSEAYGDETFTKMMMLKQFSVYLALLCGYDVLFQDVDLTWLKDPMPVLREQAKYYHVQFMDDGARNFLNAPYFVNSGFFYIRGNDMDTFKYWDHVTLSMFGDANQRVVEKILHLHVQRNGLRVKVLHPNQWTSGMHLSATSSAPAVQKRLDVSTVLHFCWTVNITAKFTKMNVHRAIFLKEPDCFFSIDKCDLSSGTKWRDSVCTI